MLLLQVPVADAVFLMTLLATAVVCAAHEQQLTMPALSPTMEQGNIVSWQVGESRAITATEFSFESASGCATNNKQCLPVL
jgi:hypothetical protein